MRWHIYPGEEPNLSMDVFCMFEGGNRTYIVQGSQLCIEGASFREKIENRRVFWVYADDVVSGLNRKMQFSECDVIVKGINSFEDSDGVTKIHVHAVPAEPRIFDFRGKDENIKYLAFGFIHCPSRPMHVEYLRGSDGKLELCNAYHTVNDENIDADD